MSARIVIVLVLGVGTLTPAPLRADEPASAKVANAKARAEAASKVYKAMLVRAQVDGNGLDPEKLYRWSRRWMEAEQELADKKETRITAVESHLERMKKLETTFKQLVESKSITPAEAAAGTFFRLEAERTLAQLKDK